MEFSLLHVDRMEDLPQIEMPVYAFFLPKPLKCKALFLGKRRARQVVVNTRKLSLVDEVTIPHIYCYRTQGNQAHLR